MISLVVTASSTINAIAAQILMICIWRLLTPSVELHARKDFVFVTDFAKIAGISELKSPKCYRVYAMSIEDRDFLISP